MFAVRRARAASIRRLIVDIGRHHARTGEMDKRVDAEVVVEEDEEAREEAAIGGPL